MVVAAREIAEYSLLYVLREHRHARQYAENQTAGRWKAYAPKLTTDVTVGVLGLGHIGGRIAKTFADIDFKTIGWSRTEKNIDGIQSFSGEFGLDQMLVDTNFLACLLPNTQATKGILNFRVFNKMPQGSYVLNAGRGSQLVELDLLQALDNGQIRGAALDVFETEPLPTNHPFWTDKRILLTPHHAAEVYLPAVVKTFLDNIYRSRNNEPLIGLVDEELGY